MFVSKYSADAARPPSGAVPMAQEKDDPALCFDGASRKRGWYHQMEPQRSQRRMEHAEVLTEDQLTGEIIGAAIEVHRVLGPGLLESIYEGALCRELELRRVRFQRQVPIEVTYMVELTCRSDSAGVPRYRFWPRIIMENSS